ncbi:hypothetical protein [Caldimonas brevitalea]|uniref:Uncharacterized protein n=1 Tax=Caldimonas brevitalea TaxID=413882 RepID=A0A0G3BQN4_9BURK|nr:hypothetical protein [Caldimonas brevitalea]AKJ28830.1 hypothetical protein AAW51_2139 [Caldimonas brevitalea]
MSTVTDIILVTFFNDGSQGDDGHQNVDALNQWLLSTRPSPRDQLVRVDNRAGGGKVMQCEVWMAAINWLDEKAFEQAVRSINWAHRDCVQLFMKSENADRFRVINFDD